MRDLKPPVNGLGFLEDNQSFLIYCLLSTTYHVILKLKENGACGI